MSNSLGQDHLERVGASVYLKGDNIEQAADLYGDSVPADYKDKQVLRDGGYHHATLLDVKDFGFLVRQLRDDKSLSRKQAERAIKKEWDDIIAGRRIDTVFTSDWKAIGLGKQAQGDDEAYYVVLSWPGGEHIRERLGLPPKDFHITLGFRQRDVHGVPKDETTLL